MPEIHESIETENGIIQADQIPQTTAKFGFTTLQLPKKTIWLVLLILCLSVISLIGYRAYILSSTDNQNALSLDALIDDDLGSVAETQLNNSSNSTGEYMVSMGNSYTSVSLPGRQRTLKAMEVKFTDKATNKVLTQSNSEKPITLTYNYDSEYLEECLEDETLIQAYVVDPATNSVIPLETVVDTELKTATAKLYSLYPNSRGYTDMVFSVAESEKYIFGCGETAHVYLEGNRLMFPYAGLSFDLPQEAKRPEVVGGGPSYLSINIPFFAYEPLDRYKQNYILVGTYTLLDGTYTNQKLPVSELHTFRFDDNYFPGTSEVIIVSSQVRTAGLISYNVTKVIDEAQEKLYAIFLNPLYEEDGDVIRVHDLIHVFEVNLGTNPSKSEYDYFETVIAQMLNSLTFSKPILRL